MHFMEQITLLEVFPQAIKMMMFLYLFLKVLDFATGLLKTVKYKNTYKSAKMREGILIWITELLALAFVMAFDMVLGLQYYLTGLTIALFVYKESGSLVENFQALGVTLPSAVDEKIESINPEKEEEQKNEH